MIPTPIPDELVDENHPRRTFVGPDGLDNVDPCEALIHRDVDGVTAVVGVRLQLEPGELERLQAGEPVWLEMLGGLTPFRVKVGDD